MKRLGSLFAALLLSAGLLFAQEHADAAKTPETKATETKSEAAADPHAQFMESPSVKFIARTLGVETKTASKIALGINFFILAFAIFWLSRTGVPAMFRNRTAAIQKGMEEARKASAESAARLAEIEGRLSKLDDEIAAIRTKAESETKAEEERLRAATEEEKQKIVQSAEQEIAAAANNARRELKNLAAELAVALAEKKIAVSEETDRILVRDFADHLNAKGRS